jgi:acetyltransferase
MNAQSWRIHANRLEIHLPALIAAMLDTVNGGGAALGFLPPITPEEARSYWFSLRPDLYAATRILIAAGIDGRIVGSGQLSLISAPNGRHRAEVQKLFVLSSERGKGIGRLLMQALHEAARLHGRRLLLLNTRRAGPAEQFYKRLGYAEVGVVPGYAMGPKGERYDTVSLYRELP